MSEIQTLVEQLTSSSPQARASAAERISRLGEDAKDASSALVQSCGDNELRDSCVAALEELGPPPTEQLPELASLLAAENEATAYWAATLLGRAGAESAPHADRLALTAANGESPVAERAVWALGKIGPDASAALPMLRSLAESGGPRAARLAKQAIESIQG